MTTNTALPFAELTPDCILHAVESLGLKTDGRLLTLNSYENRVYQVGIEEASPLVVKLRCLCETFIINRYIRLHYAQDFFLFKE